MKIIDLLKSDCINLNLKTVNKNQCIDNLVDLMYKTGNIKDKEIYKKSILEREALSTTGIGDGIAIPHGKSSSVKQATLVAAVCRDGIDYDSLDGQPSKLFFMIAVPKNGDNLHLEVLARLSTILMDNDFKESLINSRSNDEFLRLIDKKEKEKYGQEKNEYSNSNYRILAVTACPTGIAHTYMAAEALEEKAKEKGISIKVETNGSGGAKNVLKAQEIRNAECIIIAADKNVDMARFDGKKVIKTSVSNGIHKASNLIDEAINGKISVYHHDGQVSSGEDSMQNESIGHQIYKHLMNGVSHMLPFVIGGGILIALAFLFDDYSIDPSNFGMNTPFAAFLKTVGGQAFGFMLPILAGYIAMSIGDRPALAVGFVGGALANAGGSGFLGALLAGFVAGYLIVLLKKIFNKLPQSLEGIKPVLLYPFFGILIIGAIITFLINPPVGALNTMLSNGLNSMGSTSKILLGVVLGGMMSVDMGGPVNKAAYVFGTASLASGNFEIMAAVMAGGMVPPLAIALCTTFFKNRFTEKERQSGLTNYIMGLSFISEGAIPFAASDPLRVLPSCIIGSAVAGGMSMFLGCALRAPHGGVFVIPVVSNPFGYICAIVCGSIIGMFILAILKKPINK